MSEVFANGAEYDNFTAKYCDRCLKYGDVFEGERPCPIEDRINTAMMNESVFPHKQVFRGDDGEWTCTGFVNTEAE